MLEPFITKISQELQLPPPRQDGGQAYVLALGSLRIRVTDLQPGAYFHANIAKLPPLHTEEFLLLAMQANFLGQGTGGAAIGLAEDESFLTLSLSIPYEGDYIMFKEWLERFANFLSYWQTRVTQFKETHPG